MLSLLESLLNFFTEKTERERDARIFYVKSLTKSPGLPDDFVVLLPGYENWIMRR